MQKTKKAKRYNEYPIGLSKETVKALKQEVNWGRCVEYYRTSSKTQKEVAEMFGISIYTLQHRLRAMGLMKTRQKCKPVKHAKRKARFEFSSFVAVFASMASSSLVRNSLFFWLVFILSTLSQGLDLIMPSFLALFRQATNLQNNSAAELFVILASFFVFLIDEAERR